MTVKDLRKSWFGGFVAVAGLAFAVGTAAAQQYGDAAAAANQDPPSRVARIAVAQGNVSLEPSGVNSFSQAELNYPLTAGDRIYVDNNSISELQTAGLAVRLGNGADVTLSSLTDGVAQLGLAQGSIRVRTRNLVNPDDGTAGVVEIDTPNGAILVQSAGDIRVDSYPQSDVTVVTVSSGSVEVTGPNLDQVVGPNQALRLSGNPAYAQFVRLLAPDGLDQFDLQREGLWANASAYRDGYVDPGMVGAGDLDTYGDWAPSPDYGEVWYPRGVAMDWAPYRIGHWAWVAPWGWTWVDAEPWGFAPFHYGRWAQLDGRWGWVPGPPPTVWGRPVRPVYSPALVVFVGGAGVSAWFPLGPREAYVPWYHASPAYVNRVNVTNIYNRNAAEVRSAYGNRTTNVYNVNVANVTYVNRQVATTAVAQKDFASGRPVAQVQVRLDGSARAQLASAPVVPHPLVTPGAGMAAPQGAARVVPPSVARPVLATRPRVGAGAGMDVTGNRPVVGLAAQPVQPQAPVRAGFPDQRVHEALPAAEAPARVAPVPMAAPVVRAPEQVRPLVNKVEPQPVQPPFAQQQRAIEENDPGRPLGPRQVENLRSGKPAGPPAQAEPAHPAPPQGRPVPPKPGEKPKE